MKDTRMIHKKKTESDKLVAHEGEGVLLLPFEVRGTRGGIGGGGGGGGFVG